MYSIISIKSKSSRMRIFFIFFSLVILITKPSLSKTIITECVTKNGSIYNVKLNTNLKNGEIRYRWMGQDVFYKVGISYYDNNEIRGFGIFDRSNTGEIKGNPIEFTYNLKDNIFYDLVSAKCD